MPKVSSKRFVHMVLVVLLGLVSGSNLSAGALSAERCDHDCLVDVMNSYLDAMVVLHDPAAFPRTADLKATENGQPIAIGEGLWKTIGAVPYRQIFADEHSGQVGMNGVANERGPLTVFAVRLRVAGKAIAEVETLVARDGIWNAPQAMVMPHPLYDAVVPKGKRTARAKMIAAADAYFTGAERGDGTMVPAAPGCFRVENGASSENNPAGVLASHCNLGHKIVGQNIKTVRNRRYPLVDEERGLVWALAVMDFQDNLPATRANWTTRSLLAFELFKIYDGRIRRIEIAITYIPKGGSSGWSDSVDRAH